LALLKFKSTVPPEGVNFKAMALVGVFKIKLSPSGIAFTANVAPLTLKEVACELEAI